MRRWHDGTGMGVFRQVVIFVGGFVGGIVPAAREAALQAAQ